MADWDPLVNDIFVRAIEAGSPAERSAILDRSCGNDAALRRKVAALLAAHDQAGTFLERPAPGLTDDRPAEAGSASTVAGDEVADPGPSTADDPAADAGPIAEGPGSRIGPYKLIEALGEGGMGVVYLAEQEAPVRRKVALKIIKPGMDTAQVVARFEAERQALALMDHPNIARVFDAGATGSGRPFFVMELVDGVPITEYCDQARLTPQERLELFVPVCRAIQHAHQKGIIHRDVKPSNVLITTVDGRPTPKVIDFGIAKATGQRLTDRSLFTQFGAIVGTLEYMSPEQAALSGSDVDTRSDVFSLGVLLYELLTGSTPLERARLREAGYAEILRRIREEEPPRPSARLSDSGEALPSIAAIRQTEPAKLLRLVRGELDWIVMRALEKNRTRRYESASGLAQDVERYLADEPVEACPPSRTYRLRKFARAHRAAITVAASFAAILLTAAIGGTYLASRARAAERLAVTRLEESQRAEAQARAVGEFMVNTLRSPDPVKDGRDLKVVDLLAAAEARLGPQFSGTAATHGALLKALGETYLGLGIPARAVGVLDRALPLLEGSLGADHADTIHCRNRLVGAYVAAGRASEGIGLAEASLRLAAARYGPDHLTTLDSRHFLGAALSGAGRLTEAISLMEETVRMSTATLGPEDPDTLNFRNTLANMHRQAGHPAEAYADMKDILQKGSAQAAPPVPTLDRRNTLAVAAYDAGRVDEVIALQEKTVKEQIATLGPDHHGTLVGRGNLAEFYRKVGRLKESIEINEDALKRILATLGPDHPDTLTNRNNLAAAYQDAGRKDEAIALLREVVPSAAKIFGPGHPNTIRCTNRLGGLYEQAGRWADGEALYQSSLPSFEAKAPDHWGTFQARSLRGACLAGLKKYDQAEPLIVSGYEGLKARESRIQPPDLPRIAEAAARTVRLYEAWGMPEKAQEWRRKTGASGPPAGPPAK